VLVIVAVLAAVALLSAVLFGARWTPSGGDDTWVSAGVCVVLNAGK
jgi:xyloglucan fucosyltransferase